MSSLVACIALLPSNSVVLAGNNWLGTWSLDVAASHYTGRAAHKSQSLTFEATAAGIRLTSHGVAADGTPLHGSYESKFDGKDVMSAKVSVSTDGKTLTVTQTGTNAKGVAVKNLAVYRRG